MSSTSAVPYDVPSTPFLLILASFLYLINVADQLANRFLHAGLLGPLLIGIVYGPAAANLLTPSLQSTLISLGYIGLLLLVLEAGLTTSPDTLAPHLPLALAVACTGVVLPIALSLALLHGAYAYPLLTAFAAGAALCSTSLGTTLSLLAPPLRKTQVGAVLLGAALIDDVAGLVIAGIVAPLAADSDMGVSWQAVVRPIGVSLAFAAGAPLIAWGARWAVGERIQFRGEYAQLLIVVASGCGAVAGAQYSGTSALFGAYLAGVALTFAFPPLDPPDTEKTEHTPAPEPTYDLCTPDIAFGMHITPILTRLLAPIFFASIGAALPMRELFASGRVVGRGIGYAVLMVAAKFVVGNWIFAPSHGQGYPAASLPSANSTADVRATMAETLTQPALARSPMDSEPPLSRMTRTRAALLLGTAMVARGEIALIVAQIARPLLVTGGAGEEAYTVVIWAVLVSTVLGAVGVGWVVRGVDV